MKAFLWWFGMSTIFLLAALCFGASENETSEKLAFCIGGFLLTNLGLLMLVCRSTKIEWK